MSDNTREEFEEVCDSLPVKITNNEKAVAQYIWTTQQEKIDKLEAENPQVMCPACGKKYVSPKPFDCGCPACSKAVREWEQKNKCEYCNNTKTVPLTKAQEYQIKELELQLEEIHDLLGSCKD